VEFEDMTVVVSLGDRTLEVKGWLYEKENKSHNFQNNNK
jgi:hypothetical protein